MGYTHYFTQTRNLTVDEWTDICTDLTEILSFTENELGIPLANGHGEPRTRPLFNGLGDDAHETFYISRKRQPPEYPGDRAGGFFCKTARKPYDVAVTACLCYLSTCLDKPAFHVNSDGHGKDFLQGLSLARQALPRKANVLDIPMGVMQSDRWTGPWVSGVPNGYEVRFCINGKGYVLHRTESYCFQTHLELAQFLERHKQLIFRERSRHRTYVEVEPDIWRASGYFDKTRHERIARAQRKALAQLFPVTDVEHDEQPPAYVRPGDFPRPEENGTFSYSLADLINKVNNLETA